MGVHDPSLVIARLDRATQYSRDAGDKSRRLGVLDHPPPRVMTAEYLATFRRKISDFWIVADEVRKARPAALAAGVI
jgi:hypothetical protein